jgi:hypothetical protein
MTGIGRDAAIVPAGYPRCIMAQSFNRSRRLYLADYDISCPRCLHAALLVLSLDGQPTYSIITIKMFYLIVDWQDKRLTNRINLGAVNGMIAHDRMRLWQRSWIAI